MRWLALATQQTTQQTAQQDDKQDDRESFIGREQRFSINACA